MRALPTEQTSLTLTISYCRILIVFQSTGLIQLERIIGIAVVVAVVVMLIVIVVVVFEKSVCFCPRKVHQVANRVQMQATDS